MTAEPRNGAVDPAFWAGRRVLLTGHTGFKGSWLSLWLQALGARVTGFADGIPTGPSLFEAAHVAGGLEDDVRGDVRDPDAVRDTVAAAAPEVVVHMAAQPMVRRSFAQPRETFETNLMGTVNVLDAVRVAGGDTTRAVVIVTSDKCYDDRGHGRPLREGDPMGGHDPYSSSKGCAELVADAFRRSFFSAPGADGPRVASVRAGNVIGGGDWGEDRLVPDIMRAASAGSPIAIRNPAAIRPWQHVLEPLGGYLVVAQELAGARPADRDAAATGWNLGPDADDARPVSWIAGRLAELWPEPLRWDVDRGPHPHETQHLQLDSSAARTRLGWSPRWPLQRALEAIVSWHLAHRAGADMRTVTVRQIEEFAAS